MRMPYLHFSHKPLCKVVSILLITIIILSTYIKATKKECVFPNQRITCNELTCSKETNTCIPCQADEDCFQYSVVCTEGKCLLKRLGDNINYRFILCVLLTIVISVIGAIGGVGGGGVLVPLYSWLSGVPMISAVSMSQSSILGQSLLSLILNIPKTMPMTDFSGKRPLINYQYLSLLLPMALCGTIGGGIANKVMTDLFRILFMLLVMSYILYRSIRKMISQYKDDKVARNMALQPEEANAPTQSEFQTLLPSTDATSSSTLYGGTGDLVDELSQKEHLSIPIVEVAACLLSVIVTVVFSVLRQQAVSCGSALYIILAIVPSLLLVCIFVAIFFHLDCIRKTGKNFFGGSQSLFFTWNWFSIILCPFVACIAGAAAALLGLGGGLLLGILFYESKLLPSEASVTGGAATFLISFSACLDTVIAGFFKFDYGGVFFVSGAIATVIAQFLCLPLIRKHAANFMYILSLVIILVGSMLINLAYGIFNTVILLQYGGSPLHFGKVCNPKKSSLNISFI